MVHRKPNQKIEFQLLKSSIGQRRRHDKNIPVNNKRQQHHHKCRCVFEQESVTTQHQPQHRVPSKHAPFNTEIESEQISMEQKTPRAFKSKLRNIFSCFSVTPSMSAIHRTRDLEAGYEEMENCEIYHFDHGSSKYYRTTDCPPHLISELIAQRTAYHATKFWAEFFGSINIGVTFFVTFLLQLYR